MTEALTLPPRSAPRPAARDPFAPPGRIVVVIPTLNEARHILAVIAALSDGAQLLGAHLVVVDGGSSDGTVELVRAEAARRPDLRLLHNPRRLQSAAVNLAVATYGHAVDWVLRADAHADYPTQFCELLLSEARRTGADSVVVRMHATGEGVVQRNIAAAQNALFGNGGSAHRNAGEGRFVEHGHHALMRVSAFRAVGGYDERFSHNEDAELDHRLGLAGHRIWLTGATGIGYFPRDTLDGLARQYAAFGAGRLATASKHRASLQGRHVPLIALAPLVAVGGLAPLWTPLVLLPGLWLVTCLIAGGCAALRQRAPDTLLCGVPGAIMQIAWSLGFWAALLRRIAARVSEAKDRASSPEPSEDAGRGP